MDIFFTTSTWRRTPTIREPNKCTQLVWVNFPSAPIGHNSARGRDPRYANCMAHCGYESTAVIATMGSLRESLRATLCG